jgi:hypothetical protein
MPDRDERFGRVFKIDIDDSLQAHLEAARILKDAIEQGKSYIVLNCLTPESSKQSQFDGTARTLGDIIISVEGTDRPYQMFLMAAMVLNWIETATGIPREIIFRSTSVACRVLDKLKGGSNAGAEPEAGESGDH